MQTISQANNNFLNRLGRALAPVGAFLASIPAAVRAARRAEAIEHLLRLDDAQLARMGHTREGLTRWMMED
ncbi:hypothetical protein [Amaricoccus sp.]|uniref:hypothetical protein n=1 Tax=Amaricoccus sp. TaxID=1872485 RepID=UPI001B6D1422|nr:hypothetical protein [Amaricoccus sp.]MBP7001500.1 hypothetical protein [Amaricoccus sp.]